MTTLHRGVAALAAGFLVSAGAAGSAFAADAENPNEGDYWEQVLMDPAGAYADKGFTNVECEKVADDYTEAGWTADADYLAVILKAGSGDEANQVVLDVAAGTELTHSTGKDISHVIACTGDVPTEPEEPGTPEEPEEPGTPGDEGDDAGEPIGPIVQTDVPAKGVNGALPLAALAAAGLGIAAVGLRRRGQEG